MLVVDERALASATAAIAAQSLVAIDTEFVRERTYYPELCLVQVGTDELVACVDCLASLELDAFLDTLLRPSSAWVLHSARQDLEVFWNLRPALPASVTVAVSDLLTTDVPLLRIVERTGFEEQATFSRKFRGWLGMTPTEFRKYFPHTYGGVRTADSAPS